MPNEIYDRLDELERLNASLTQELKIAKTEIESLQSTIERLQKEQLSITEKFVDAKNEIDRLDMVRKRNQGNIEFIRRHGK